MICDGSYTKPIRTRAVPIIWKIKLKGYGSQIKGVRITSRRKTCGCGGPKVILSFGSNAKISQSRVANNKRNSQLRKFRNVNKKENRVMPRKKIIGFILLMLLKMRKIVSKGFPSVPGKNFV